MTANNEQAPSAPEGGARASDRDALEAAEAWIRATPHGDDCFVSDHFAGDPGNRCNCGKDSILSYLEEASLEREARADAPIDMVLHCPACGMQHVDAAEPAPMSAPEERGGYELQGWENPPHRSHLCHDCGHIWRPADVPTNGVLEIKTKGKADSPIEEARASAGVDADTLAESLYEHIKHGDEEHRAWLRRESLAWCRAALTREAPAAAPAEWSVPSHMDSIEPAPVERGPTRLADTNRAAPVPAEPPPPRCRHLGNCDGDYCDRKSRRAALQAAAPVCYNSADLLLEGMVSAATPPQAATPVPAEPAEPTAKDMLDAWAKNVAEGKCESPVVIYEPQKLDWEESTEPLSGVSRDVLGASPAGTALSAPAADAASAPIAGARLVGRRVQACDMGQCEGATIMTEPQRGGGGDWQVLVLLDSRPDYLTPLGINYLWLKEPS